MRLTQLRVPIIAMGITAHASVSALALQPPATRPLAITHITVIDVESGRRLPDRTVLIDHDTIASVGSAATVTTPNGMRVVDGRGKFLIPGLIDTHVHLALFSPGERDSLRALGALLAHGVTGVRDAGAGGRDAWLIGLRAMAKDSLSPRIYVSGMVAGRTIRRAGTDTRTFVQRLIALGVDGLKIRDGLTNDDIRVVLEEGARAGIPVYGHTYDAVNRDHDEEYTLDVVRLGASGTMHIQGIPQRGASPPPPPPPGPRFGANNWQKWWLYYATGWLSSDVRAEQTLIDTMVARRAWLEPTLITEDWITNADTYRAQWTNERLPGSFDEVNQGWPTFEGTELEQYRAAFTRMRDFVRRFRAAGGLVVTGTDCVPRCGYGLQDELRLLVLSGFSPAEALKAATVDAARVLGWGNRLGRVAPGQWADLVLLDADPLLAVGNMRRVAAVVSNGRYLDRTALDALLARDRGERRQGMHGAALRAYSFYLEPSVRRRSDRHALRGERRSAGRIVHDLATTLGFDAVDAGNLMQTRLRAARGPLDLACLRRRGPPRRWAARSHFASCDGEEDIRRGTLKSEIRDAHHCRCGKMLCSAMQNWSVRYGCMFECGTSPPAAPSA